MANEISEKKQPPTPASDDNSFTPTDAGDDNPASSSSSKPVHTLGGTKMKKNVKQNVPGRENWAKNAFGP